MKKLSLILCIALCLATVSCAASRDKGVSSETTKAVSPADSTPTATIDAVTPTETIPEETPEPATPTETTPEPVAPEETTAEETPEETTPAETTAEATLEETTPETTLEETTPETTAEPETEPEGKTSVTIETPEATPAETTPEETTPAETPVIIPPFTEAAEFYHYENLPDAYAEIPADMMAEIEALVDVEIDWENHYLGNHKGYAVFGVVEETTGEYVQYYYRSEFTFGFFTNVYCYKDGELTEYLELYKSNVIDWEENMYVAYMGAKKAIGELPDADKELSAETIQVISARDKYYADYYYGTYNGYVIFGGGPNFSMEHDYFGSKLGKYCFHSAIAYVYSPETGIIELRSAISKDLIDITAEDLARAAMVSTVRYIIYMHDMHDRVVLPES